MLSIEEIYCFIRMIERQYTCRVSIVNGGYNIFFSKYFPDVDTAHLSDSCNQYKRIVGHTKSCMKCDCYDSLLFSRENTSPFWKICPAGLMELVCTLTIPGHKTFQLFIGTFKPRHDLLPEHHLDLWHGAERIPGLDAKELTDTEFAELPLLANLLTEKLIEFFESEECAEKQMPRDPTAFITEYIDIHFRENISLTDLAEKLGWSPSHTTVRIKQFFGKTFLQLLTERRIKNTQWLLRNNYRANINTIARVSGFQTSANFHRCFLKYTGMTPNEYRKKAALEINT